VDLSAFLAEGEVGSALDFCAAKPARDRLEARPAAAAAAAQAALRMFAHDVRRPFSMLRILSDLIANATSLDQLRATCTRMLPELDAALSAVDGMLQDALEAGSERAPRVEDVALAEVLRGALVDAVTGCPRGDVALRYDFRHERLLRVEPPKVRRVFANIVANALEAMDGAGNVWCTTSPAEVDGQPFALVRLGNDRSCVPDDKLRAIFEPTYTAGKRGGTGLGLAIVRKIIEAHGGRIWCVPEAHRKAVEFHFTLPLGVGHDPGTAALPATTGDVVTPRRQGGAAADAVGADENEQSALIEEISSALAFETVGLVVLAVDDSPTDREWLATLLARVPQIADTVELVLAATTDAALQVAASRRVDLVICDIDMGAAAPDGFALARQLRAARFAGRLCLHSNRGDPSAYVDALRVGADAFLPKPMGRTHFLRLLRDAARDASRNRVRAAATPVRPIVAVIDDDPFIRQAWEERALDAQVLGFAHAGAFFAALDARPDWQGRLACVVVDQYFEEGPYDTAAAFIGTLAARIGKTRIVVSSDAETSGLPAAFPRIDKMPLEWRELAGVLRRGVRASDEAESQ
jgi:nitrogen-specific signal transduction histidine kinase/CheY-like chemotaxis protein